jgi:hypothetical protein
MARGSEFVHEICELCAEVCLACATECEKHPQDHCQACAKACRHCADECNRMAGIAPTGRATRSSRTTAQ